MAAIGLAGIGAIITGAVALVYGIIKLVKLIKAKGKEAENDEDTQVLGE